ncbi:MAG: hypothetical protein AAGA31_18120, partial [Bacteroidota bacterium]
GHHSIPVGIYGARITLLHFPLIFIIGQVFTRRDVIKMGRFILWLVPPMVGLIALQFYSPQSAWVNRGVGGDLAGAGFSGALGFFRPPATFSFTNGTTLFFNFAAAFVGYFWLGSKKEVSRIILLAASVGILLAIPLSLSRGYFFQLVITTAFFLVASLASRRSFGRVIIMGLTMVVAFSVLNNFSFFQTSVSALLNRFELASVSEGGLEGTLVTRFLGGMFGAIGDSGELPFWGQGIGMGTNVGSALITGSRGFLVGEAEWRRVIGELGPILGIILIMIRVILSAHFTLSSFGRLRAGDALPWLLASYALLQILNAQWAQPTAMGFSMMAGGLVLASLNQPATVANVKQN